MTDQAAQFTGSVPQNYDRGLGPVLFQGWAHDISGRVASLNPKNVLELAAGTGIVTRQLRDLLPAECDLVATDLNTPMLDVAKQKFQPEEAVVFEQADAMNLPYQSELFDLVLCQFGVMFFPDKVRSHSDVHRVLKPNGHYLFTLWDSWDANPFARVIHETIARFFPEDPPGFYKVPYGYHDAEEIRSAALEGGFDEVSVQQLEMPSRLESARAFAEGLIYGNPLYDEVIARGGAPADVCDALTEAIATEMGDELLLRIILAHARKK
jgi:ubiquinone/menaquinone biosynthesis C-methylase UbiE